MSYKALSSYKLGVNEPVIQLEDGTIVCQTGEIKNQDEIDGYCFVEIEGKLPQPFSLQCEMIYQKWLGGWEWPTEMVASTYASEALAIRELVGEGKTAEAVNMAIESLGLARFPDLARLWGRIVGNTRHYTMGMTDLSEYRRVCAQINYELLDLVEPLVFDLPIIKEDEDFISPLPDKDAASE